MDITGVNGGRPALDEEAIADGARGTVTAKLEKAADISKFLFIEDGAPLYSAEDRTSVNYPLTLPDGKVFTPKNIDSASRKLGSLDVSKMALDIADVAVALMQTYMEQRDEAEKMQVSEEKQAVQKIRDQAQEIRKAAVFNLIAGISESAGSLAGGIFSFGGAVSGKGEMGLAAGEGLAGISKGIIGLVTTGGKAGAEFIEADEKDMEAQEKFHENQAEDAKRKYSTFHDAIQQTIQILTETSRAQQDTQKEIARRI